jgi:flagellin-like protein
MIIAFRPAPRRSRGISEVMGALLLIVVVIVAVAALASFVAVAQSNAESRSVYLSSVKNENLQIVFSQFKASKSSPALWKNVTLTIRNTNTGDSQLSQVRVSNYWVPKWYLANSNGTIASPAQFFGSARPPLLVPAKGTENVFLNLTGGPSFYRNASLSITLLAATGNFFTTNYSPPTAIAQVGVATLSYQYFNRDFVSMDATRSQGSNDSQIMSYSWLVGIPYYNATYGNPDGCTGAAFGNPSYYQNVKVTGELVRFFQEASIKPSQLGNYCLSGPFKVGLSVIDGNGFIGNSTSTTISADPNMAPTATLSVSAGSPSCPGPISISLGVRDVFGRGVPNALVLASHTGDVNSQSSYTMSGNGLYTTPGLSCTVPSSITFTVGSLPPVTVSIP